MRPPRGPIAAVDSTGGVEIAADFFVVLFLFGLHIKDVSLKLRPVQLSRSPRVAAAANHVSRQSDTIANTAS